MFRKMLRFKQQLSDKECISVLKKQLRGVLSVHGDDGYPYGLPINYYYCEEDGKLYFHCAKVGHKIDAIRRNDKASFCVCDDGVPKEGDWSLNFRSVITFGRIEFVEDRETVYRMARELSYKFTSDESFIQKEIDRFGKATMMFALIPEHMTGKLVNER